MESTRAIGLSFYTLGDLERLADAERLTLSHEVAVKIDAGALFVQRIAEQDRYIYGVNTGFGPLCETRIGSDELETLQYNHVVSHACGVDQPVSIATARLVMLIKLLTFRTGHIGITRATVERLLDFWNHGIVPCIPKKGTVGASGDLAPLAHMALPLLGLGRVYFRGEIVPASRALAAMNWTPIRLRPKEGLALTNGVQYINAHAVECLLEIRQLIEAADVIAALSIQAFSASRTFYQTAYHQTCWHEERLLIAANLQRLLADSNHFELPTSNRSMQDPYSFRCIPQVHAAVRQAFQFAVTIVEKECNGVSDNPLFFPDQDLALFGGNLHGESTAMTLDFLAIAVSELASISERRTYQLLSGQRGLPSALVERPGLNTGLMVPQLTAAALVNENKVLATPASIDTIPTAQLQEDHVSMGGTAAYKLREIVRNCKWVLAIELLSAAQAIDLNRGLRLSKPTDEIFRAFRRQVPFLDRDRIMSDDIDASLAFLAAHAGAWTREAESSRS
jgi:histidine ammonia-lyase